MNTKGQVKKLKIKIDGLGDDREEQLKYIKRKVLKNKIK